MEKREVNGKKQKGDEIIRSENTDKREMGERRKKKKETGEEIVKRAKK